LFQNLICQEEEVDSSDTSGILAVLLNLINI